MTATREDGRALNELRPIIITRGWSNQAEGSALVEFGDTRVLCTASVLDSVPPFLRGKGQGWVTAEYGMLPRATHTRSDREAARGKQSGRTQEIQRLIGRSLRAVTDLKRLGERTIHLDCDVLQADGGTRTAAITGAWVALRDAVSSIAPLPVVEVHLSNVHRREEFRHHSFVSPQATAVIAGAGAYGYVMAVDFLAQHLAE